MAGEAVAAAAADHVALAADEVAGVEVADVGADLDDLADELVAHDERRLDGRRCPGIPGLDVQVRAADAGLVTLIRTSLMPTSGGASREAPARDLDSSSPGRA